MSRKPILFLIITSLLVGVTLSACHGVTSAVDPQPRKQYWWSLMHQQLMSRASRGDVGLLFLGDSITLGMDDAQDIMQRLWAPYKPLNFGIGGDGTQHLLWRLQNGEVSGLKPKVAVVLIGTNNLAENHVDDIVHGVKVNVEELRKQLPLTRVVVLALLPRSPFANDRIRKKLNEVNAKLPELADNKDVFFIDVGPSLLQPDGTLTADVMPDYLHPSHKGYEMLFTALKPKLDPILGPP